MKIKDVTWLENLNTITMAIENNEDNFDTENRLLEELLERVKDLATAAYSEAEDQDRASMICTSIENDIDDLVNMVGMNYYVRGIKMGARLRALLSDKTEG